MKNLKMNDIEGIEFLCIGSCEEQKLKQIEVFTEKVNDLEKIMKQLNLKKSFIRYIMSFINETRFLNFYFRTGLRVLSNLDQTFLFEGIRITITNGKVIDFKIKEYYSPIVAPSEEELKVMEEYIKNNNIPVKKLNLSTPDNSYSEFAQMLLGVKKR